MEKQIIITYNWYNVEDNDLPIDIDHQEILNEEALDHIQEMIKQGYVEGELVHNAWGTKSNIEYEGNWTYVLKDLDDETTQKIIW